jgi:transcriptional regulator with XRE-family HTH domain
VTKSAFSRQYGRFRNALVDARRTARLTQAELAKKLRRPQSFVSKYERGQRRLDVVEFLDVARVLKLNPAAFLSDIANSQPRRKERP